MRHLAVLFVALAVSFTARALTVRPPSFTELVASADTIVQGEVTAIESTLHIVNGRPVPFTHVTIAVSETLKGTPTKTAVLQYLGGTIGTQSLRVVGLPEFAVGDRGFFFVQNNGSQFFPLVGAGHGLYRTMHDKSSGTDYVVRANGVPLLSAAGVIAPLTPGVATFAPESLGAALTPTEFSRQIKAEIFHAR